MIKIENVRVFNFEGALRGMRNPKESHHLSDSIFSFTNTIINDERDQVNCAYESTFIGPKDMKLAQTLIAAGTDHSKFMRQIFISMDITAPLYWWKEADTYKVGTVANSESTMHKLAETPITRERFSYDEINDIIELIDGTNLGAAFNDYINTLELLRKAFVSTKEKKYWRALIQMLPDSWMQKRTITFSYQTARAMYFSRDNHKLEEWAFLRKIFETLPYGKEFICYKGKTKEEKQIEQILEILNIDSENKSFALIMEEIKEKYGTE